ncbi:MAG: SPOR domain-containing protein [Dysgonamonadaceae bacterium]|jgi:nucleoid DNA-binding protein|nr:SPOR domain-containing protein [Dysgonamonadaceae bacterium]
MKDIYTYISYLLSEHDCVIIPEFGGFVVNYEPAKCSSPRKVFEPPVYTVGFNSELSHNDGLLVNTLMRLEKINYKTAQTRLRQFANHIQSTLNTTGEINFPEIGKLTTSSDGEIEFSPAKSTLSNASMYGFANFYMPSLKELETNLHEMQQEDTSVIRISISKRLLKFVACAAAIVFAFLMISTPLDNVRIPTQYAAILNLPDTSFPRTVRSHNYPKQTILHANTQASTTVSTVSPQDVQDITERSSNTPEHVPSLPEPTSVSNNVPGKTYYIIVSSSTQEHLAQRMLPDIRQQLAEQADIIGRDNLFRIYVASFSDKQEAEGYLNDFRMEHPKYKSAWMLAVNN